MTALNVFCWQHRLAVLTDGAHYDAGGVVTKIAPKCHIVDGNPIAYAVSGLSLLADFVGEVLDLGLFQTIDDVEVFGPRVFANWREQIGDRLRQAEERHGAPRPGEYFIAIVGWSASDDAPKFILIHSDGRFQVNPGSVTMPRSAKASAFMRESFQIGADGIELLEVQRRDLDKGRSVVGGHVMVTLVTPDGISQLVTHHWHEDRVGELIRPQPRKPKAVPAPSNIVHLGSHSLNRKERRALEKRARKATA